MTEEAQVVEAPATPEPIIGGKTEATAEQPGWKDLLDDQYKSNPSIQQCGSLNDMAKDYVGLKKMLGTEKVPVPKDDSPQEDWDRFYDAGGRPREANDYSVDQALLDGLNYNEEAWTAQKERAHKAGLTQKQFNALYTPNLTDAKAMADAATSEANQKRQQAEATLQAKWGADYQSRLDVTNRTLKHIAGEGAEGDELVNKIVESGLTNEPDFVEMISKIGMSMLEDTPMKSLGALEVSSPAKAMQEVARLKGDAEFQDRLRSPTREVREHARSIWETAFKAAYPE